MYNGLIIWEKQKYLSLPRATLLPLLSQLMVLFLAK